MAKIMHSLASMYLDSEKTDLYETTLPENEILTNQTVPGTDLKEKLQKQPIFAAVALMIVIMLILHFVEV